MKFNKQLILPIALIVVLSLYMAVKKQGEINYQIPRFDSVNKENFTSLAIDHGAYSLKLYFHNGIWRINPDNLRVDPAKMDAMLEFIALIRYADLVSETSNYINYGLDEKNLISVKAWIGNDEPDNPSREIIVGNTDDSGKFTFVRGIDNSAVFTTQGDLRKIFDQNFDSIIDKRISNFVMQDIDKIALSIEGRNFSFFKTTDEANKDIWETAAGGLLDKNMIEQSLRYLSSSRFTSYRDSGPEGNVESLFRMDFSGNNLSHFLRIDKKENAGFISSSSFAEKPFLLEETTGTQIIKMFKELFLSKDS